LTRDWRRLVAPPTFDDPDTTRLAWVLHWVLLATVVVLLPWLVVAVVALGYPDLVVVAEALLLAMAAIGWVLTRRGHVRAASVGFTILFWVIVTVTAPSFGGLQGVSMGGYPLVVLTAGFLLGRRAALGVAALSAVAAAALFVLEPAGVSTPMVGNGAVLGNWLGIIGGTALFAHLMLLVEERRRNAIREGERQLAEAQRLASVGSWEWDMQESTVTWSDELFSILGVQRGREPVHYESFRQAVAAEDRPMVDRAVARCRETGEPFEFRCRIRRPDGVERIVNGRGEQIRGTGGMPRALRGTVQDVTDLAAAEHAVAQQVALRQQILASMMDGFLLADASGRILEANAATCDLLGYTRDEMLRRTIMELDKGASGDDILERLQMRADTGARGRFETKMRRKDGSLVAVEVSVVPMETPEGTRLAGFLRDVTDRLLWEEALRESEQRYRTLFENSPVGIGVVEDDGTFVEFNDTILEPGRYTREDIVRIGNVAEMYYDPADRVRVREKLSAQGSLRQEHTRFRRKDGHPYEASLSINPVLINGRRHLLAIVEDVTVQSRAEQLLRESEQRYRSLFEESHDAVYVTTTDGVFVDVNPAALRLFGYARSELTEVNARDLYVDPARREAFQEAIAAHGAVRDFPVRLRRKDGTVLECVLTSTVRRSETNEVFGYQGIVRDVTERRRAQSALEASETRYRTLVELSPDAIAVHRDGIIVFANGAAADLVGASSSKELLGLPVMQFVGAEDRAAVQERQREILESGRAAPPNEERFVRLDGTTVPVEVRAAAIDFEGAGAIQVVVRDVSERHAAERALRESERRFRAVFDQSLQLLGIIALDGTLEDVNATALAMIGENRENVINKPFWETPWWSYSPILQDRLRGALVAAAQGEVVQFEVMHYDVEGNQRTVDATIAPMRDDQGDVTRLVALGHDVTERQRAADALRQSEERFSKAFGLSPDAITVTAMGDGKIVEVNGSFTELSGWTRDEAIGRSVLDLEIWPDPRERDAWVDRLNREHRVRNAEMQLRNRSGQVRVTLTSAEVIDLDGRPHLLTYVRDISALRDAERALHRSREGLRRLAAQLQEVREEERTTIAREIHDELGQRLTGMKMDFSWLLAHLPKRWTRVHERGRALTELLDVTIESVRDISTRLRPSVLDDLGLAAAIEWQASDFARRTSVTVDVRGVEELSLDRELSTTLFRILQEALTNVARHAEASQVSVSLRHAGADVVLEIVDDGRGLGNKESVGQRGLGLLGMRERAASFGGEVEFERPNEGGTCVRARIPITQETRS